MHPHSTATSSHHASPYQASPEYSSGEDNSQQHLSQPSVPEATHHSTHESIADDGRPRSVMYNSLSSPFGASTRSTSYIDHSSAPSASLSSSMSAHMPATVKPSVRHHLHSSSPSTSPIIRQLYDNQATLGMASETLPYWAHATLLSPETTTSSLYPSAAAAFTTSEALASAELL